MKDIMKYRSVTILYNEGGLPVEIRIWRKGRRLDLIRYKNPPELNLEDTWLFIDDAVKI